MAAAKHTKVILSGSTDGRVIPVSQTATVGTPIHTASGDAGVIDEVWLEAVNVTGSDAVLTLEWGGVLSPADHIVVTIPPNVGIVLVVNGLILANGLVIGAFSDVGDAINIGGWVNRITPAS